MTRTYFPDVHAPIAYEGPDSKNPLAFRFYEADRVVGERTMAEHLRFAVCWWHTFWGTGADAFGPGAIEREWLLPTDPMERSRAIVDAAFELFTKLGVRFYCFHDADVAPPGKTLAEEHANLDAIVDLLEAKQGETGVQLLWGTSNLFSHRRYTQGAATSPDLLAAAHAAAQVKKMLEVGKRLGEHNHVFWGGREGYSTLLNTDLARELDHLGAFLRAARDYAREIGNDAQLLIEPKPKEPTKHQYDFDAQSCIAFLQKHELIGDFKLNIETNHATLAGHTVEHDLEMARIHGVLGSVDANRGDPLLGWDTDQFPDVEAALGIMLPVLRGGGFTSGGLNFDAKVRRDSFEPVDLFHAHIGAMDNLALGFLVARSILDSGDLDSFLRKRYESWDSPLGQRVARGEVGLAELAAHAGEGEPALLSGRQEALENLVRDHWVHVLRAL